MYSFSINTTAKEAEMIIQQENQKKDDLHDPFVKIKENTYLSCFQEETERANTTQGAFQMKVNKEIQEKMV